MPVITRKRRRKVGGTGPRADYSRRADLPYLDIAAVFRTSATAAEAAARLGLTDSGARSLRCRMRAAGWDVGEGVPGRPRMPRGDGEVQS